MTEYEEKILRFKEIEREKIGGSLMDAYYRVYLVWFLEPAPGLALFLLP